MSQTVIGLHNCSRGLWKTKNGIYWVDKDYPSPTPIESDEDHFPWYDVLYIQSNNACPINPTGTIYEKVVFEFVSSNFAFNFRDRAVSCYH